MSAQSESITTQARSDLDKLLADIDALEAVIATWDEHRQRTVTALKHALDALNKEALTRLIRALKSEPTALPVLKEAVSDEVVYAVLRHLELVKPSMHERIEQALDSVRPSLASHGGNVELVAVQPPDTVEIRLTGACDGCPASSLTLSEGVEKAIRERCPEVVTIIKAKGGNFAGGVPVDVVSPFAKARDSDWIDAALLDEIPEADIASVEVGGQSVLLCRFGERVRCYRNACAHLGMALDSGAVSDGILTCPHHGFRYALPTGECLTVPEVRLHAHAVRAVGNRVQIRFT